MNHDARALLAGLSLGATAGTGLSPLGMLLGGPLLASSLEGSFWRDAARGGMAGTLWYTGALLWLPASWQDFAAGGAALTLLLALLTMAWLPALVQGFAGLALARGAPLPLAMALPWAVAGELSSWQSLPTDPALFLADSGPLLVLAALGGRPLLDAAWGALAGGIVVAPRRALAAFAAVFLLGVGWRSAPDGGSPLRVAVLQPDTGAFESRRSSSIPARTDALLALLDGLPPVDVVALPEGSWPAEVGPPGSTRESTFLRSFGRRAPALVGVTLADDDRRWNSVLAVLSGQIVGRYDKIDLVPLAERRALGLGRDRYVPGRRREPISLGNIEVGALICYEDLVPSAVRRAAAGADLLLLASNDTWLREGRGSRLHLAAARLAAVTSGRFALRPTTSGISGILDPRGDVRGATPWIDGDGAAILPGRAVVGEARVGLRGAPGADLSLGVAALAALAYGALLRRSRP